LNLRNFCFEEAFGDKTVEGDNKKRNVTRNSKICVETIQKKLEEEKRREKL
jgi:hypothetical protein